MRGLLRGFIIKMAVIANLLSPLTIGLSGQGPSQEEEKIVRFELPNGMKVIIQEKRSAPVVAIQVWVRAGSTTENEGEEGITHLIEHMIFKGTPTRPVGKVAREIEACGGRINAYTSHDYTVYHITIASRFFEKGMDVIADVMGRSLFDPEELEKEKDVIIEEIRMGEDDPSRRLSRAIFREAFRVHPYGRPIIGYSETVKAMTRNDILQYYSRWYVANNMVLVIVGDIEMERARKIVENRFSYLPGGELPKRKTFMEPEQRETRLAIYHENINEAYLGLAFHIPHARHKDIYALDCLAIILAQGESSRLYQEVKAKRELVHSISAYAYSPSDPGLFVIVSRLEGNKIKRAFEEIYKTILHVGKEGVKEDELRKARLNMEKDFIHEKETVQGQAEKLGYFEVVFGDINFERQYLKAIQDVKGEDIKEVVAKYFHSSNLTVTALIPKGITIDLERNELIRISRQMEELFKQREDIEKSSSNGQVIEKRMLPNGIRVILKEEHSVPLVSIWAVFLGGLRFERQDNNGINNFLARMLTKGTKRRNAFDLARDIDGIAGEVSGFSGKNSFGLSGKFLSRFFTEGMEIFSEILIHPAFKDEEMEKMRKLILADIKNQEDDLARFTFLQFTKNLYKVHPYRMNLLGTRESISTLKRDDIIDYYNKYAVPENMVICIVGDIDLEKGFHLVKKYFGDLQRRSFSPPSVPEEPPLLEKREVRIPMEKRQVHMIIGFPCTTIFNPDRYPMEVLNTILSAQGGRLFVELRDRESLAYSLDSFFVAGLDTGYFGIYLATSPEKVKRAEDGIKRELRRIISDAPTDEEVEIAKGNIVGNFEIGLQGLSSQAMTMALHELYGLGFNEIKRYPEKILSVRRGDVLNVARKYIDIHRSVVVMVGPVYGD